MPTNRRTYKKRGGYVRDGLKTIGSGGGKALGSILGGMIERFTGLGGYRSRGNHRRRGGYGGSGAYYGRQPGYARKGGYSRRGAYGRRSYKGRGAYTEVEQGMIAPLPPQFKAPSDKNYVEICHREYIGDVYSSSVAGSFAVSSFYINPSDTQCFPWLSNIAASAYQQYEMAGCVFEFKSFSADALNSTNTALGCVVSAINYDSTDPVPTTRAAIENTDWSQAYKPSQSFLIPVECDRKETFARGLLYTRQSAIIPTGQDRRLYDMARIDIASLGMQGTSVNLGSLYVTYKCRLYKSAMFAPLILAGCFHYFNNNLTGSAMFGSPGSDTIVRNSLGFIHSTGTVLTLPLAFCIPGAVYKLDIVITGSSITIAPGAITLGGCFTGETVRERGRWSSGLQ